jgi:hypothetical protein
MAGRYREQFTGAESGKIKLNDKLERGMSMS